MYIDDCIGLLTEYENKGYVSPSVGTEVMNRLMLFSNYPDNIIIPGGPDLALLKHRYGDMVFVILMKHLGNALAGRAAVMDFAYNDILSQAVQQDPQISNLLFTMYFKMWAELRTHNIEHFPYEFSKLGATNALFSQLCGNELLTYAGI